MSLSELCLLPARDLAARIAGGELSCTEVMRAFLARIEALNPAVNAICTLDAEGALQAAEVADRALASETEVGPLHGLPMAIKDLADVAGLPTTYGSPLMREHVPSADALFVERLRAAGALMIGKTNTPEWGAGSHTFNPLFGHTHNPYDLERSAGGSSGGAAAALATGMLPLADGSDLGGSLRNPASFCNVVGLRPSPGRVPVYPSRNLYEPLSVLGPMARDVEDAALLLSVMAGPDARDPLSIEQAGAVFREPLAQEFEGLRVAWSPDLGHLPVETAVIEALQPGLRVLEELGCRVESAEPDLRDAEEIFLTLRSLLFADEFGPLLPDAREQLKDTIVWNTEHGLQVNARERGRALRAHAQLYARGLAFFDEHDFLVLPAAQVLPFPGEWEWVREIEGVRFDNYLQWMQICCAITLTGLPAISVPAGMSPEGLPVGLQIVAGPHRDRELLQFAHGFEQATRVGVQTPDFEKLLSASPNR